jgi:dTDP-glucose pyrophosphorylase/CBS domain-containing protein
VTPREVSPYFVGQAMSIRAAVARMDASRLGIVLVVDEQRRLLGTITDGDVRRAVLAKVDLDLAVTRLLDRKAGTHYEKPLTAPAGRDRFEYLKLLKEHNLLHLPLLDPEGRVSDLVSLDEFVGEENASVRAVVMAGGKGSRLMPLTADTPKPMLRVGDRPLMEIILEQLRDSGIKQVQVSTHYHRDKIVEHFGDGRRLGVNLSYLHEDQPLGTAGALGTMETPSETMLVMNGDVLTQMDFRAMLAYHREMKADLTVAVTQYDIKVPYGVVECEGSLVTRLAEKPTLEFFVGAGIYLLEPSAFAYIPKGQRFDMTDLIQALVSSGHRVASFPILERWLDIGQQDDYARAQQQVRSLSPDEPEEER